MRAITQIPISKNHIIPICSFTSLCILILALFSILIPFFLVFTDGFFKNSIQTHEKLSFKFRNQYYIQSKSTISQMISTNLDSNTFNTNLFLKSIKSKQEDRDSDGINERFTFQATIGQLESVLGKVKSITVVLFFNVYGTNINSTAMAIYNFYGSSLSSVVSTGSFELIQNNILSTNGENKNYTTNVLTQNSFNIETALQSYYQQDILFKKISNDLISNGDSSTTNIKINLNLNNVQRVVTKAGVFQQIQWSWCYYIPLTIVLGYLSYWLIDILLKYGILQSRISRF